MPKMSSSEIRDKFLNFFKERNHKIVPSSSLIPKDQSVLFTSAGMQQFKEYYLEEKSPYGENVVTVQKCFRTSDIEEVGDKDHLTFLEMLGNFSFGGYFKEDSCKWALEFLVKECQIPLEKLAFTYFKGEKEVPRDEETKKIWIKLGIKEENLFQLGMEDNFWGPTGDEGPCGPTTEIHYDLTGKPCSSSCDPACQCGRFVEIWNLVFNQYFKDSKGKLTLLKKDGVDTGMGLERLSMIVQGKEDVFKTDLFSSLKEAIGKDSKESRIIADHIKSIVFLTSEGITPSNTGRGYILRRLLRRVIRYRKILSLPSDFYCNLLDKVFDIYKGTYLKEEDISKAKKVMEEEGEKFEKALEEGLKELEKITSKKKNLSGKEAFYIYSTYGFPPEMIEEIVEEKGLKMDLEKFKEAEREHRLVSRKSMEKKFGGLREGAQGKEIELHTATHILYRVLRDTLGKEVKQKGSDITPERLRFDFSFSRKIEKEELEKIEKEVNEKIKEISEVKKEEVPLERARKEALYLEEENYPKKVSVYSIFDKKGTLISKEICHGPHINKSFHFSNFKILKEQSSSAGVRRIKATLN